MSTINWNNAKSMINAYLNNPRRLPAAAGGTLKGLRVGKDELEAMLNQTGHDIQEMMILFAVREEDLNKDPNEQFFTTVLVGIDSNNQIVTEMALDYHLPCPSTCPDNIDDVLQEN